jgi:pimeloyl-ACP methyl ester carboxylesterase
MIEPYRIAVPEARLADIRARVAAFDWDAMPDAGGWRSGVGLADLRRLVARWQDGYDWRATEARLNALPHFLADVEGQAIHFIHARGDGSRPPLLLVHGWPGSFLEFEPLIAPLVAAGHDVVVPSLPGYAFSGRPAAPIGPRRTAELFHALMAELFGERRFVVQGGDWGGAVTAWMAHLKPAAIMGLHLNMLILAAGVKPETAEETEWATRRAALARDETGYFMEQATRPQTLGVAMTDSPVGVAAWILEKFGAWADVPRDGEGRPDLWAAFDVDTLLDNIMLYVAPQAFVTSTWMYRGCWLEGSMVLPAPVTVPTAVAAFRDPVFPPPPRSLAERSYAIARWSDMPRGGHFAALEQPDAFRADLTAFVDSLG